MLQARLLLPQARSVSASVGFSFHKAFWSRTAMVTRMSSHTQCGHLCRSHLCRDCRLALRDRLRRRHLPHGQCLPCRQLRGRHLPRPPRRPAHQSPAHQSASAADVEGRLTHGSMSARTRASLRVVVMAAAMARHRLPHRRDLLIRWMRQHPKHPRGNASRGWSWRRLSRHPLLRVCSWRRHLRRQKRRLQLLSLRRCAFSWVAMTSTRPARSRLMGANPTLMMRVERAWQSGRLVLTWALQLRLSIL